MTVIDFKEIRRKLGISQEGLGKKLGVSLVTINRWERGVCKPSPLALEKIKQLEETYERN